MRRAASIAAFLAALSPLAGRAQTAQELLTGSEDARHVLNYGMGYGLQRYSPLAQINRRTIKRLVPAWNHSYGDNHGAEAQPLVYHGRLFVTTAYTTVAIDAASGKQVWKARLKLPPDIRRHACCGFVNRGAALYEGRVFRTTLDSRVIAYDAKTGRELWSRTSADHRLGYTMTAAPLVAEGVLINGVSCGVYGGRGYVEGWDPETGKRLWRTYTIPEPGEPHGDTWPGETWKTGGGPTWLTGSFDPARHTVYWGVGNASPSNPERRKGDNLYTNSVLALDPKTGRIKWHYQFTPNDPFGHDGNNELVQATLTIGGKPADVLMQANKNGFFYVLSRDDGGLLAANPFVRVTWSTGVDPKTGRPVESEATLAFRRGRATASWPAGAGGKNWGPMSYNPGTGLVYANALNMGASFQLYVPERRPPEKYLGQTEWVIAKGPRGFLKAIDPMTGRAKWEAPSEMPRWSATLTTAGGLVFTGQLSGEFEAFDARTGARLWRFQTGSGIVGQPVTWLQDGVQYIAVSSGLGGSYYANSRDPRLESVPLGGSLWAFALLGD